MYESLLVHVGAGSAAALLLPYSVHLIIGPQSHLTFVSHDITGSQTPPPYTTQHRNVSDHRTHFIIYTLRVEIENPMYKVVHTYPQERCSRSEQEPIRHPPNI